MDWYEWTSGSLPSSSNYIHLKSHYTSFHIEVELMMLDDCQDMKDT
jgi:hypothetical protein